MASAAWVVAAYGAQTAFAFNALSFVAVIVALLMMRPSAAERSTKNAGSDGAWLGLRYIARSRNLLGLLGLCFVLSAFGRNFQVTMAAMVTGPLHGGAGAYGFLSTVFALGTVVGAVVAAQCKSITARVLLCAGGAAAALQIASAGAPGTATFAAMMAPIAAAAVIVDTASSYLVQTKSDPAFRGRVLAAAGLVSAAAGAIGGPLLGWLAVTLDARAALAIGGLTALTATLVCAVALRRRLEVSGSRARTPQLPVLPVHEPRRVLARGKTSGGRSPRLRATRAASGPLRTSALAVRSRSRIRTALGASELLPRQLAPRDSFTSSAEPFADRAVLSIESPTADCASPTPCSTRSSTSASAAPCCGCCPSVD
jgi:hypothetical protein